MSFSHDINPGPSELAAHGRTTDEIAEYIQADHLVYLTLEGLKAACRDAADRDSGVRDFEVGVFNGKYVTGVPEGYFEHLSSLRQAGKKRKAAAAEGKTFDDVAAEHEAAGTPFPFAERKSRRDRQRQRDKEKDVEEGGAVALPGPLQADGSSGAEEEEEEAGEQMPR